MFADYIRNSKKNSTNTTQNTKLMKKFLRTMASLAVLATLGAGASFAQETVDRVIEFKSNTSDATNDITDAKFAAEVTSDPNYVKSIADVTKVYAGKNGLKFSTGSVGGKITLNLTEPMDVKKVTVEAYAWKANEACSLTVNGKTSTPANINAANITDATTLTYDITGETTALKFEATKRLYVKKITLTVVPPAIEAPTFELIEGADYTYTVKMSCATEGAEIYYTDNETDPTAASTKYTAPVEAWPGMTLKAIAIKGSASSPVTTYNPAVPMVIDSFSPMLDFPEDTEIIVNGKMTAVYQNGNSLYAKDSNGAYMLIFGKLGKELKNGDTFNVLKGVYKPYNNLPEVTGPEIVGDITTGGEAVQPMETTIDMLYPSMLNMYFKLDHVSVSAFDENRNATMKDAYGSEIVLRDNFKLFTENFEPSECMNVTGFLAIFGETLQFYPTAIEAVPLTVTVTLPDGTVAEEGGTYTIKVGEKIVATAEGADMINIYADKEGSDEKIDVSTEEGECEGTLEWTAENVLDSWNMVVSAETGLLKKSVSFTLSVEEEDSGVEAIETAGAATYFNLQGVRVEKPAKGGIYIRVADGIASKVVK